MPVAATDLDDVYSYIGEVLTDSEIELLVKQATGKDIYNEWATQNDPRKVKIRKTIEALKLDGNERWLLTYILIYVAAQERLRQKQEKLRQKVVTVFPQTLKGLPQADTHVGKALVYLQEVLNTPFSPPLKIQLQPKKGSFAEIVQRIVTLLGYKNLQELLLLLLFTLNYNEALLANPVDNLDPNLESVARQIDNVVNEAPAALAMLGPAAPRYAGIIAQLTPLSNLLRAAVSISDAGRTIDDIQRLVRLNLSQLNGEIFTSVYELSFEPQGPLAGALLDNLPDDIESRNEFKELVQQIRDLTATVLARAFKCKLWQDAENQMSLVGNYFDCPGEAVGIAQDWLSLTSKINWLAELEPNEQWSDEAKKLTVDIDSVLYDEKDLDDEVRMHFEAYRKWFGGPFKKIDEALKQDCGSLRKMDDPLTKILNELA